MVRILALLVGAAFIFAGLVGMGYFPQYNLMTDGLLFGYFEVDQLHNTIHLATGGIAILCMLGGRSLCKLFFILIGLLYGAAAVMGFWNQGDLHYLHVNLADNYLHALIAVVSLLIGFSASRD